MIGDGSGRAVEGTQLFEHLEVPANATAPSKANAAVTRQRVALGRPTTRTVPAASQLYDAVS